MKIAWFSAGITSTVACKIAIEAYSDVELFYIHINTHHPDNARYIMECEQWYGKKINVVQSQKYADQFEVIEKTRYVNGPMGARCTLELKKEVRRQLQEQIKPDAQIFGFEFSRKEINRAIRFKEQNPETNPVFPLIEARLTKNECAGILLQAGIQLPEMYRMGYSNNNCIGCVKGKNKYWNKIRQDFPDVFAKMAETERAAGHSCIKKDLPDGGSIPVFLDELKPSKSNIQKAVIPDCGLFCQVEFAHLIDPRTDKILNGELLISKL